MQYDELGKEIDKMNKKAREATYLGADAKEWYASYLNP
jgi:hypothetical protein